MAVLRQLDGPALRRWCDEALAGLRSARAEIDQLNVYPVPDGDTGTNLVLTMESVAKAVADAEDDWEKSGSAMARGALLGARGNSGVILSELLRGWAEVFAGCTAAGPQELQAALVRAAERAYASVAAPVEGTVLTVAREAAAAAAEIGAADLPAVARAARAGAAAALASTPQLLPALAAAGVVDAGGRGLCVLLEALESVVTGVAPSRSPATVAAPVPAPAEPTAGYQYEVQYLLRDTEPAAVSRLRETLAGLGDSLLVAGDGDLYNVHVHVDDVAAAVEAGIEAGRPFRLQVTRFADQHRAAGAPDGRVVVAVAAGAGLRALFESAGAAVVGGGPGACPSTSELLAALRSAGAAEAVLLPNDPNVLAVAQAAADVARAEGRTVAVVPTRSPVQGLAALAVADGDRPLTADVATMSAAAGATRWAEVTVAVREAMTMAGVCRPGDVLGLIDGDVAVIGPAVEEVTAELLDRLLRGGGELVTAVLGADAPAGLEQRLRQVAATHPAVEVHCYDGGQPGYPLLLGVE